MGHKAAVISRKTEHPHGDDSRPCLCSGLISLRVRKPRPSLFSSTNPLEEEAVADKPAAVDDTGRGSPQSVSSHMDTDLNHVRFDEFSLKTCCDDISHQGPIPPTLQMLFLRR